VRAPVSQTDKDHIAMTATHEALTPETKRNRPPVSIDVALQGGGAHGAYTWGVLDRLLDEEWLGFEAISGASAGAMNAVVLAHGLLIDGRPGAKKALETFWRKIAQSATTTPMGALAGLLDFDAHFATPMTGWWSPTRSVEIAQTVFSGLFSPYQFNPFNLNPLLDILKSEIDFEALKTPTAVRLLISATRVSDGSLRIFRNADLSADAVMASACLPELFHAVHIDGESYWDGGYVANPALEPLINETDANDLLLVQLNPPRRARDPNTAKEIAHRLNEISFNANLTQAIHLIGQLKTALGEEPLSGELKNPFFRRLQNLRLHRIAADEEVFDLGHSTKLDPRWGRLRELHDHGAQAADDWLKTRAQCLGARSSIDCALL
jgi:NTE family protein